MDKADIAQKGPYVLELEPGTYWWCSCGRSKDQPFCDGSHEGTGFVPVEIEINDKQTVAFCGCKQSADKPYCDRSHDKL